MPLLHEILPRQLVPDGLQLSRVADAELKLGVCAPRVSEDVLQGSHVTKLQVHLTVHAQALPQLLPQQRLLLALACMLQVCQLLLPEQALVSVRWGRSDLYLLLQWYWLHSVDKLKLLVTLQPSRSWCCD